MRDKQGSRGKPTDGQGYFLFCGRVYIGEPWHLYFYCPNFIFGALFAGTPIGEVFIVEESP